MSIGKHCIRVLKKLIPALVILMLMEGFARIVYSIIYDIRDSHAKSSVWYQYSPDLCWQRRPNFTGKIFGALRTFDEDGFFSVDTLQVKQKEKPRILILGDSCSFGNGVDVQHTYGEVLEQLIPDYAIINATGAGYSSYQGLKTLQKYIDVISPNIIIASFNFNDRRYVLHESDTDSSGKFRKVYFSEVTLRRLSYGSYLLRSLRYLLGPGRTKTAETGILIEELKARVPPDQYRENLIQMVKLAQQRGICLIFLLLSDNPIPMRKLMNGINLLKEGKFDPAIADLTTAMNAKNDGAWFSILAKKYLAQAYAQKNLLKFKSIDVNYSLISFFYWELDYIFMF